MALAGPQGEALSFALGADLGASMAAEVAGLADADPVSAAYRLGQLSGPILAGAVLGVVGAGAVALGVRAARVLWGMLDELPALGALAQRLKATLPEHSPDMATADGPDARPRVGALCAAVLLGGAVALSWVVTRSIRRFRMRAERSAQALYLLEKLAGYAIVFAGAVMALSAAGLNLSSLAVFAGAIGIGVGLVL